MPTAAYTAQLEAFSKIPTLLVKLTIEGDLSGSPTQVFRFSPKEGKALSLQLTEDVRPYLLGDIRGRPTRIRPDASITERHSVTLRMIDDPNAPAFDSTVFSITTGGSFFRRLKVAAVSIVGSKIEILRGFVASPFPESDFETIFKGRVEDINFAKDQTVQIVAKDLLVFIDKRVPSQISDGNLVNGAVATSDTTITIDNGDEITDPDTLPSKDFFPIVIRLEPGSVSEEDIIIGSRSGNVLNVQQNLFDRSEEFDDTTWDTSGSASVVANQTIGPLGGDFTADTLKFPAVSDSIRNFQPFIAPASKTFTFSIWLKSTSGSGTITISLANSSEAEINEILVSVTDKWKRFSVTFTFSAGATGSGTRGRIIRKTSGELTEVFAWGAQMEEAPSRGFYAATTFLSSISDAGRGAFGTSKITHPDNSEIREVAPYRNQLNESGVNPIIIARDFVNRATVALADIDLDSFEKEFDFSERPEFRRGRSAGNPDTTIDKPTNLLRLIKEVREQALFDVFVNDSGKIAIRYSWRSNLADETSFQADDETNIMEDSFEIKNNSDSRFTRIYVYFKLKVDTDGEFRSGDRPDDFEKVEAFVNFAVEKVAGARVKPIFSKWIFRAEEAITAASRFLSRFERGARILRFDVDVKDDSDIILGQILQVNSDDLLIVGSGSADRGDVNFQVTQKVDKRNQGIVSIECMEHRSLRFGLISPAGFPDYDAATGFIHLGHADRLHGFIGRASDNKVGTALDEGYVILALLISMFCFVIL